LNTQTISTKDLILTEDDVRRLIFGAKTGHQRKPLKINKYIKNVALLFILFAAVFIALNSPAYYMKAKFIYQNNFVSQKQTQNTSINAPVITSGTGSASTSTTNAAGITNVLADNYLYIDRISLAAPIIWDVADDNASQLKNLQNGVIDLAGQAKPGQNGNIFIVGHSSYSIFAKGHYKTVFALLPELVVGDKITITYQNQTYKYVVTATKVVNPNDVSIRENTADQTLTLMTCVPVGTNLNRLAVIAKPVNASVSSNLLPLVK
jgi:LPXTG-site transpeptidase (sortase) family protein